MDEIQKLILETIDMELATSIETNEFKEFCNDLDSLDSLISTDLYLEEVNDGKMTLRRAFKGTFKNTTNTTLDLVGAYGGIVDGNANAIKSFWDLFVKVLNLGIKVIVFILKKIAYIPNLIIDIVTKVSNLPKDITDKLDGNIKVYITTSDISELYNNHVLNKLTTFISMAKRLSQGTTWGTFFYKRNSEDKIGKENDIKICRDMGAIYVQLKSLQFTQSTIYMKNKDAAKQYFGTSSVIEFTDISGKKHKSSYYEALVQLVEDIKSKESELKDIYDVISNK